MASSDLLFDRDIEFLQSIIDFNYYLSRYTHSSWIESLLSPAIFSQLSCSGNVDYQLSKYLIDTFKLNDSNDYDFDNPIKRLALMNSESLLRLIEFIGVTLNERVIRNALKRSERELMEGILGKNLYHFGSNKARFLFNPSSGTVPEFLIDWKNMDKFKLYIQSSGAQVLGKAYSGMPAFFLTRLLLKLPKNISEAFQESDGFLLTSAQSRSLAMKINKEVNKSWHRILF